MRDTTERVAAESGATADGVAEAAAVPERRRRHVLVQATVPPLDEDGRTAALVGSVGFALASVIMAVRGSGQDHGGTDWGLWVCLAGLGIGLLFIAYCELRLWLRTPFPAAPEAERAATP